MKQNRKIIALIVVLTLLISCISSSMLVFAEDEYEDQPDESTLSEEIDTLSEKAGSLDDNEGLVAHWKFDGDLKDSSTFKNDGQPVGGKNGVTFVDGVNGKGVKLDGKSYISVKGTSSLDLTDQFTFSFWVYKEDMRKKPTMDGGVPYIMKNPDPDGDHPYGIYEWWELTPGITFCDESGADDIHSSKQVDLQKWSMLTFTYDGSTMSIYIDKDLVKREPITTSLIKSSQPLYIGFGHFMTVDNYFKGILDDMKIYNTALNYAEVEDLFDDVAGKAPGKDLINKPDRLVAYYKFEDNLSDLSGFNNNGKAIKANNFKYVNGVAGKGVKFSGSSYIEVKDSDSLDLDRGFTFGMWVFKEKSTKNQPLFAKYGESRSKGEPSYSLVDWNSGQHLSLSNFDEEGDNQEFRTELSTDMQDGKWFYYTATYSGKADEDEDESGDDTVKLYINGRLVSSTEFSGDISNSTGPLWIGGTTDGLFFKGIIDEFRIYNYALSPTEVNNLFKMRDSIEVLSSNKKITSATLKKGQSIQLTVNALTHLYTAPSKAVPKSKEELKKLSVTSTATYKSNNTAVVKVSAAGKITAVGKGSASITIQYGSQVQSISVKVN